MYASDNAMKGKKYGQLVFMNILMITIVNKMNVIDIVNKLKMTHDTLFVSTYLTLIVS